MSIIKKMALAAAAVITMTSLFGCSKKDKGGESVPIIEVDTTEAAVTTVPVEVETYPDYPVNFPSIEEKDTGTLYEAENAVFKGSLSVEYSKDNYSGEGYVSGFLGGEKSSVAFNIQAPSNQHYDISLNIASDREVPCTVSLNGSKLTTFMTDGSGRFTQITLHGVFLVKDCPRWRSYPAKRE